MARKGLIDTSGIVDLTRDLGRISKDLRAAEVKSIRDVGDKLRDEIRSSTAPPYKTGALRRSVKTSVRVGQLSLYSRLPYANVQHWGGTIRPRGTPIHIERTGFIWDPAKEAVPRVTEELGEVLDATAARYGFVGP